MKGHCEERFAAVGEALDQSLASGADLGASVAVALDGELVVDLHGGWADAARTTPWSANTLVNVWSNTKTVAALAVLMLIDRSEIDPLAPVATYWPEFAQGGKEAVDVRHLLSHTSGVAGWDMPVTMEDVYDAERSARMIAAQAPWWTPGSAGGYHALSYGHLLGELVRRVTGKTMGRFVADEIAGPLQADFHIGLDPVEDGRVSPLVPPPPLPAFDVEALDHDSAAYKLTVAGLATDPEVANTAAWRRSEICASGNGHGNARSLATVQAPVSHEGSFNGVRLLSPETCALIFQEQFRGTDLYLNLPIRWGIGYALSWPKAFPYLPDGRVCFWAGWGGSMVINDLDRHMTLAYVMNKMEGGIIGGSINGIVGGLRSEALIRSTYEALGVPVAP